MANTCYLRKCTKHLRGFVAAVLLSAPAIGVAQSADALIDKLVEKGILTVKEANELREEVDKNFTQAHSTKTGLPEWSSALKFNGDFRGRFEGFYSENDDFTQRDRWRYRARFGVTASLFEGFEVGLRLGSGDVDSFPSGGIDPISNNQSFQNNASKKGIFIDLAYGKWTAWNGPSGSLSLTVGKMENPFVFSDMVFDNDYTPEGAALQAVLNLSDAHALKLNGAAFAIDELGASREDPFVFGGQVRYDSVWSKKISTSAGAAMLGLTGADMLANSTVPNINVGNTRNSERSLKYDYYPVIGDAYLTYTFESFPYYPGAFPVRLGGEVLYNNGAPSSADNYGWSAGVTFGKAGKRKTWEAAYTYKWLGANAWWEEVVDSDFGAFWGAPPAFAANSSSAGSDKNTAGYYAGTNVKGHILKFSYSPYDFLTLSAKWFYTDLISADFMSSRSRGDTDIHRLQVDAVMKF